jgi:aspartate kinase
MAIVVQKYGGSSVADLQKLRLVAERVVRTKRAGHDVVVVVSAMGDTTDELLGMAKQISAAPDRRELDMLLTAGERISMALLAMAIGNLGQQARSFTGSQAGVITDGAHGKAKIIDVTPGRIEQAIETGAIAIVAGFQGVSQSSKDITTLGRGGSDTTAVALACALQAERCDILTDVDGIYTADPRVVPGARKVDEIGYEEMLELAQLGARVMHPRAVELAELYDLPILVSSSFSTASGTLIHRVPDGTAQMSMEIRKNVRGIAHDTDVARITLIRVPDRPGIAAAIFQALADASISVDTIAQSSGADGTTDLSFTVSRSMLANAIEITARTAPGIAAERVDTADDLAKISIVGTGMQSAPGYAARMFGALASASINISIISTSDIKITCVIPRDRAEDAVRVLHSAFELDRDD